MIAGHSHPHVVKAVSEQAAGGMSFGAPTVAETALASRIAEAFSSIEKVRLVNSGTEAVMTAARLARARTGRDMIIKTAGCYHGHSDFFLVAAGSGLAENAIASSPGVPEAVTSLAAVIPYNDVEAARAAFRRHKDKIAAVIVEPVAANMGVVPPAEGYLAALRRLCDENSACLIFDEVITGFRAAHGGAQELYGIDADITCLGKIIGGGLPIGAVGASAAIMDLLAPDGPVYQAGTLSGNPLATAAANATLDILDGTGGGEGDPASRKDCYGRLESTAALLEEGLLEAAKSAGVAVTVNRVGSIMSCFFTTGPVRNFSDVQSTDIDTFKAFFAGMLARGIYLAPSAYEAMFVSLAHSRGDIEKTAAAAAETLRGMAG
jgi:glutamate-1-semialdehyde 2,1-aminomutase